MLELLVFYSWIFFCTMQSVWSLFCPVSFPAQLAAEIALDGFLVDTTCVHRCFPFSPRCMPPVTLRSIGSLDFSGGF